nr:DUF433 domain-containing protein [uncultured Rhodopila sp.]
MGELHRITAEPGHCGGRPCLRGLRIRVRDVLDLLAAGASREEILEDNPLLEAGDITAALECAARLCDRPVLRAVPSFARLLTSAPLEPGDLPDRDDTPLHDFPI